MIVSYSVIKTFDRSVPSTLPKLPVLLLCMAFLSGCAGIAPGSKVELEHEKGDIDIQLLPADYREAYFIPKRSNFLHCRAPGPDYTVQASEGVNLGMGAAGVGKESLGAGENQSGLSLGGRSADVLITRELMYRACELASNINADPKTTLAIYERFLKAIERIAKTQTENGVSSLSDSSSVSTLTDALSSTGNAASESQSSGSNSISSDSESTDSGSIDDILSP